MKGLAGSSVDSIVTDPPYELGFMGKGWDRSGIAYDVSVWRECLRVLKPGGHLLAFGGSRTYHRLACAIEDAGFEIRDQIQWLYGSGFPKSLDVSKAIDAHLGAERRVIGMRVAIPGVAFEQSTPYATGRTLIPATAPATAYNGYGTALKPAHEPIVLARKPLIGTVAANVLEYGTGGLSIDGCRIETDDQIHGGSNNHNNAAVDFRMKDNRGAQEQHALGRWPANVIHDGSEEVLAGFPETTSGTFDGNRTQDKFRNTYAAFKGAQSERGYEGSTGSAARFFYCAKASKEDRNDGCEDLEFRVADTTHKRPRTELDDPRRAGVTPRQNHHPTVKPTDLMRYLCRLVTPPNGIVLDPFTGSGSTGKAAMMEGLNFIGIELSPEYCELAQRRIEAATRQGSLFSTQATASPCAPLSNDSQEELFAALT